MMHSLNLVRLLRFVVLIYGIFSQIIVAAINSGPNSQGICQTVDVRNTLNNFEYLKGCRVVEGSVHILLLDKTTPANFENITFPELYEITGFLVLYRVAGLQTLGKMFPNLQVIRGKDLLYNHALIIYEVASIKEIGLYSLTDIERGAVYISKNVNLCFASTIDWGLITKQGSANNVITYNKAENECEICREDEKRINGNSNERDNETKVKSCPVATKHPYRGKYSPPLGRHLCWSPTHCQKVCPASCGNNTCDENGVCCTNDQCLGSCYGPSRDKCRVCKNLTMYLNGENLCTQKCPATHDYVYLKRRCVSAEECRNITKHKPYNGTCILKCPPNYEEARDSRGHLYCRECKGRCEKHCPSAIVNSIHTAQDLKDCVTIQSLEITIRDGINIVHELYDNLGQIREIVGYLKVTRSYPLISLGFLKNLLIIHGRPQFLDQKRFALVVKDNFNLQELFDFGNDTSRQLKILNGRVQFHYNPKLCVEKIDRLVEMIGLKNVTEDEIQRSSNGDKTACNLIELPLSVHPNVDSAQLEWEEVSIGDDRHLLGYIVYWMKTDRTNISIYESRDACGGDGWNVRDVPKTEDKYIDYPLFHLEAYTNYAVYVKTYTIASESKGAISKIHYFKTLPGVPNGVVNLTVTSNDSSTLIITWKPPAKPNGLIEHYKISIEEDLMTLPDQRDYCHDGIENIPKTTETPPELVSPKDEITDETTVSKGPSKIITEVLANREKEAEAAASFEDELQNWVYVKRQARAGHLNKRTKREIDNTTILNSISTKSISTIVVESSSENPLQNVVAPTRDYTTNKTELVVRGLKHYRQYKVKVRACREKMAHENDSDACSFEVIQNPRTLALLGADDVVDIKLESPTTNQSLGMVRISWTEPPEPNGFIQKYIIEYKRISPEKTFQPRCVNSKTFHQDKFYDITDLLPGNYSLRVKAVSLSGQGRFSKYYYFYISPTPTTTSLQVALGVICSVIAVLLTLLALFMYFRRYYLPSVPNMKLIASVNPEYVSTAYVPDDWEVPRKKIELIRELGQGSFGMVYEGVAHDVVKGVSQMRCAIKTVNEHATDRERIEFLNEASVMKAFDTAHVVRLLGVVSQGQPTLVIMELMSNGDLKSYLRSHRPEEQELHNSVRRESPPSLKRVLQMAIEIADGMAYLTAKKFVHRDLAARNCMVSDNLTVKIGDFGMTRDIYETDYYRKGSKGLLPVRWMAPESLKDGVFQSSSDVWSYGVVLWEMATLASQPYQGLSNEQVLRYVIDGGVMERPENCPDKLYELMRLCWQHKSSARPTFLELATMLLPDASAEFRKVAFYFTKAGQEALATQSTQVQEEAEATTPLRPINTGDDDEFSLDDSCSERDEMDEASADASVGECRVSFPGSSFLTAAYHDKSEQQNSAANGFVSTAQQDGNLPIVAPVNTTQC